MLSTSASSAAVLSTLFIFVQPTNGFVLAGPSHWAGVSDRSALASGWIMAPAMPSVRPKFTERGLKVRCSAGEALRVLQNVGGPLAPVLGMGLLINSVDKGVSNKLRGAGTPKNLLVLGQLFLSFSLFVEGWTIGVVAASGLALCALGYVWATVSGRPSFRSRFAGKTVWITGASSGIGEEMVHAFHRAGAKVIMSARRKEELQRVQEDCMREAGSSDKKGAAALSLHTPQIICLDLSKPEEMAGKAKEALKLADDDAIDILINNGGVSTRALGEKMGWEVDANVMNINYLGPVALTKAVLPSMVARGGHIVAVSSVQGLVGLPARTAYSASKHALHGFFDGLRAEVAARQVHVTLLCPGYVRTALSLNALDASGGKHGKMDENTNKGMPAEVFVEKAMRAIAERRSEVVIAQDTSAHLAPFLRVLTPSLLEWVMRKRAKKELASA